LHRIGQWCGEQVFKLVTDSTMEKKIAAVLEKRRNLLDSVVIKKDDPGLLKSFTREELMDMLAVTF